MDVADYLLKPITFDRFFRAVERYYRDIKPTQITVATPKTAVETLIQIKSGTKYHKVAVSDISYIESLKLYDARGRLLMAEVPNRPFFKLDITHLDQGIYHLEMLSGSVIITHQVTIIEK